MSQAEADARNAQAGSAYTLGRNILTTGLAPFVGGLEYLKDRAFNEGGWAADEKPYAQYVADNMEAGNKSEGVIGLVGSPINTMGGAANILKGVKVLGSPFVRGAAEGAGMSTVEQYNTANDINPGSVVLSGLLGGLIGKAGDKLKREGSRYEGYLNAKRMERDDPFEYIASSDRLDDVYTETLRKQKTVDPNGLYPLMHGFDKTPDRVILKKAKEDIASRSALPRKISTISDREAHEHLNKITDDVQAIKPENVDISPKNPLSEVKSGGGVLDVLQGGLLGHYMGGPLGMVLGGTINSKLGRSALDKTLTKTKNVLVKASANPLGKFAGGLPFTALSAGLVNRINEKR
jgi:hypothetical protein